MGPNYDFAVLGTDDAGTIRINDTALLTADNIKKWQAEGVTLIICENTEARLPNLREKFGTDTMRIIKAIDFKYERERELPSKEEIRHKRKEFENHSRHLSRMKYFRHK